MTNKILVYILLIFVISCASIKKSTTDYHPIVKRAMETSLYSDRVDWADVNEKFIQLSDGKMDQKSLVPALGYLANSMGDKHATFRSTDGYAVIAHFTGNTGEFDPRDSDFVNDIINDTSLKSSHKLLNDDIGYLNVVSISPQNDIQEESERIRKAISELADHGVEKWIVDLRINGGGTMNPMISGLAPLIGEGFIGGQADANNNLIRSYKIKEGQFYDTENLVCEMDNSPSIDPNQKVVVLLSRYTISSGELVAVVFKGRKNTLFIGEETAGYTTANGWDQITEDIIMCISSAYYVDRDQNRYLKKVAVDEEMVFEYTEKTEEDAQIQRAIEWLNN